MNKKHRDDIDQLVGTEYIAGNIDFFDANFFIEYGGESTAEILYNQIEWAGEFWRNLCTIYGPMTSISLLLGVEFSEADRRDFIKSRMEQGDFDPSVWGFTSIGVDVARRIYNAKNKDDPITSALVNDKNLLLKLAQKRIPITTSLRGNRQYTLDTVDGIMDKLDYWNFPWARYGHCRTRRWLEIFDNYKNKYKYQKIEDLELCMKKAFESRNVFLFFRESSLSDLGKIYLKGMREKVWNWERAGDFITRFEASRMALKKNPGVKEKDVWNGKNGSVNASIYEVSVMFSRAFGFPVYLWTDRNKEITRGDAIRLIYKTV